jgi:TetR/AcrR family transcriptional repressor of nem operon
MSSRITSIQEGSMKVSREQVALNRERIVETAARLFREKGYDGIGVADLMKGAGLTHGGFYGHFESKEALLAEACGKALEGSVERWKRIADKSPETALQKIAANYLSTEHRDHPGHGCPVTALGADVARLGAPARKALTDGARGQMDILAGLIPGQDAADSRRKALAAYAGMVGALVLARAVDDQALSEEVMQAVADSLRGSQ